MPVYILLIILLVAADQLSKLLALNYLKPIGSFPLLGSFLELNFQTNTGAAFSMLQNQRWLFIAVTVIMVLAGLYFLFAKKLKSRWGNVALCLIIAGGLGNLIDRIFRHYVVDFVYFRSINFAVFNLADSFVVVGAIILCLFIFISEGRQKKKAEALK